METASLDGNFLRCKEMQTGNEVTETQTCDKSTPPPPPPRLSILAISYAAIHTLTTMPPLSLEASL